MKKVSKRFRRPKRITAAMSREIDRRVSLAVRALDDGRDALWSRSAETDRDRLPSDRIDVLEKCFEAWRVNPLAKRIVSLTTQYVVGGGVKVSSPHKGTNAFLEKFWKHDLNRMRIRIMEWCDELSRSGDLFISISTGEDGMSYVRAIPAAQMKEIETAANDLDQELAFVELPSDLKEEGRRWVAVGSPADYGRGAVMMHFAVNRPVGAKFGESDLVGELKWLTRFSNWLEDRARLNKFRQVFMYVVKGKFGSEAARKAREKQLASNPPAPGSVLVTDSELEEWDVLAPKLDSFEAQSDGLSIKKMIAVGVGLPLHFLAEPESSTRTTAESAGTPTYRSFEQRQIYFLWVLSTVLRVVVRRAAMVNKRVKADAEIAVVGGDISARDNAALALAFTSMANSALQLYAAGLIDETEVLRLVYRFGGEEMDIEDLKSRMTDARLWVKAEKPASSSGVKVDSQTGDVKNV